MPEIHAAGLKTPIMLVGTQSDLRTDVKVCYFLLLAKLKSNVYS